MFGRPITLFKMLGFSVRVDVSWILIAILVTWSLAAGFFPMKFPGLGSVTYWIMGAAGMVGLFMSIIFHELCHSLVARQYGLPMKGITLFLFGGVAEMTDEPPSAKAEFLMAIAGPASSVLVAIVCYIAYQAGKHLGWGVPVNATLGYLSFINLILVAFNLLPGFPLDGGRVLRSILWYFKDNIRWATRVAAGIGSGFGILLIVLGVFTFISGAIIQGMWYFLIGLFLKNAANASYQQIVVREALGSEPVSRFMKRDVITVSPDATIEDLVDHYIYRYHFKLYPIVTDGHLAGCVSIPLIKNIPRTEWTSRRVRDIAGQCGDVNVIRPDDTAMSALAKMNQFQVTRLLVIDGDRLVGIITLKDMLSFLSMKTELERL
jgi:Zn-dependent protease/CBS domain-containing protein